MRLDPRALVPVVAAAALAAQSVAAPAQTAQGPVAGDPRYQFETPAAPNQNRVYWVERQSGIVGACQYQASGGGNGSMLCFEPGEGSVGQAPGDYALLRSSWPTEYGIFRVDRSSGRMALCFVRETRVVCSAQAGGR